MYSAIKNLAQRLDICKDRFSATTSLTLLSLQISVRQTELAQYKALCRNRKFWKASYLFRHLWVKDA